MGSARCDSDKMLKVVFLVFCVAAIAVAQQPTSKAWPENGWMIHGLVESVCPGSVSQVFVVWNDAQRTQMRVDLDKLVININWVMLVMCIVLLMNGDGVVNKSFLSDWS